MTRKTILRILVLSWLLLTSSCAEYIRIQKSQDASLRYSYAKKYYNEGKYRRVAELMVDVLPYYDGTQEGAQALYIMADALLQSKQEESAAEYFRRLYSKYPQDRRAAEARFKTGLALYRVAPDPRLDQSITYSALKELQSFVETYPQSPHRKEADLYYNLGTYLGNNYISSIITARNALKSYPYTKHREDLLYIILRATYQQAINSVESKQQGRLREVIDAYYNYENAFPNGKYIKRAKSLRDKAERLIINKE